MWPAVGPVVAAPGNIPARVLGWPGTCASRRSVGIAFGPALLWSQAISCLWGIVLSAWTRASSCLEVRQYGYNGSYVARPTVGPGRGTTLAIESSWCWLAWRQLPKP